jgi:hypothetical protein
VIQPDSNEHTSNESTCGKGASGGLGGQAGDPVNGQGDASRRICGLTTLTPVTQLPWTPCTSSSAACVDSLPAATSGAVSSLFRRELSDHSRCRHDFRVCRTAQGASIPSGWWQKYLIQSLTTSCFPCRPWAECPDPPHCCHTTAAAAAATCITPGMSEASPAAAYLA